MTEDAHRHTRQPQPQQHTHANQTRRKPGARALTCLGLGIFRVGSGGELAASPRGSLTPRRQSSSGRLPYTARRSSDSTPRFDSAVGYAEGYAAGLEQAKEVVMYTSGLDVTRSIEGYDLSRSLGRHNSGRLPPLTHSNPGLRASGTSVLLALVVCVSVGKLGCVVWSPEMLLAFWPCGGVC